MLDPRLENASAQLAAPVNCIHRTCDDMAEDHGWHFHPRYELTLFVRSSGTRYVGDSVARYGPGDLVLSGPNLPHCWRNCTQTPDNSAEWLTVQFEPSFLGADFLNLPEATNLRILLGRAKAGIALPHDAAMMTESRLREIVDQDGLEAALSLAQLLSRLTCFEGVQLASPHYHRNNVIDQRLVHRLDLVNAYIGTRFRGVVSQAEVAETVGMSTVAFSKFMRAAAGESFSQLVKVVRINEACRLLASGTGSITDVALECGYQHTSLFNGHFKELKGVTPSDYRDRMRDMAARQVRS